MADQTAAASDDSGTQDVSSSLASRSSGAKREAQSNPTPVCGRLEARRGSTTRELHRAATMPGKSAAVMPVPVAKISHVTPFSVRRRYSSRIIRTSVMSVAQQVDHACNALRQRHVNGAAAHRHKSLAGTEAKLAPTRGSLGALTSGMQLDPLRRLSMPRASLESSSQMGAW